MAQYRVLRKSFIDNHLREEGAIIEFDGEAGDNLELIKPKRGKAAEKDESQGADEQQG